MRNFGLVALAFFASCAQVQAQQSSSGTAISGKPMKVYTAWSVNPDCSSTGAIEYRTTKAPEHGSLSVTSRSVFPQYAASNERAACNKRRVNGLEISYTSVRGYSGPDSVSIEIIYASGTTATHTATITVKK